MYIDVNRQMDVKHQATNNAQVTFTKQHAMKDSSTCPIPKCAKGGSVVHGEQANEHQFFLTQLAIDWSFRVCIKTCAVWEPTESHPNDVSKHGA